MLDGLVSILALSLVAVLCVVGVFHHRFDDTLGQRIGMSLIGVWCILRVQAKLTTFDTEPVHMILHIGLACYACGTALKIWRAHKFKQRHDKTVQLLNAGDLRRVAGGSDQ